MWSKVYISPAILIAGLLICAYRSVAQEKVIFQNNTITLSSAEQRMTTDPVTGQETTENIPPHPVLLNGDPIYGLDTLKDLPVLKNKGEDKLSAYLFQHLETTLDSFDDGSYILDITNVVIDKNGKLVYYVFNGLKILTQNRVMVERTATPADKVDSLLADTTINDHIAAQVTQDATSTIVSSFEKVETSFTTNNLNTTLQNSINADATKLLARLPLMKPAQINHVNVNCTGPVFTSWSYIVVKNHKAVFVPFYDTL